jgi:hypothetical protein
MATVIKLKRSTTADSVPTTSDLADGEVAINIADQKIYVNNGGTIVEVANAEGSAGNAGSFTTLTASGATTLDGAVTLGNATADDIVATGRIASHLIPKTNDTYDLGTSSLRWRTAYLAASTLDLGGATISSDGTGTISITGAGATLPSGSLVGTEKIAGGNAEATLLRDVPFFKTGNLSTANVTFSFKASGGEQRIFDDFTLASGSAITTQTNTLFSF